MAAHGADAVVIEDLPRRLGIGDGGEAVGADVADGIAELDHIDPDRLHLLEQPGEVARLDPRPERERLAADGQAEGVGPQRDLCGDGAERGGTGSRLQEVRRDTEDIGCSSAVILPGIIDGS